jgi:hypothetical protein
MVKSNVAADDVPVFTTVALLPGEPVAVVPTETVAAIPAPPSGPIGPCMET